MNLLRSAFANAALALAVLSVPTLMRAQGVDDEMLVHPPASSWPGYHGDYSGRRHSSLTQITPENVKTLGLAWAFQTDQRIPIKSSPLVVDGIVYFTVPENVWALDARSGHQIWHYTYSRSPGEHIGHRGVAMYHARLEPRRLGAIPPRVCRTRPSRGRSVPDHRRARRGTAREDRRRARARDAAGPEGRRVR